MTTNGDPLENALAERVNGIIKNEYFLSLSSKLPRRSKASFGKGY